MFIDDQNPGQGSDEETVTPNNSEGEEETPEEKASDPLDAIEDEEARAEAKRHRAIARRIEKKKDEEETPTPTTYATKDDLKKLATNDAKKLVSDEIRQVWDELVAIPLGGYDPLDSESVAKNMQKRYALYIIDHPEKAGDPTADFTKTPDVTPTGSQVKKQNQTERPLPNYTESTQPQDWYK